MEPKKISFGFNKLSKKTNIISNNAKHDEKKVELIECLEGQSIKVKDVIDEVKQPLVIPIKDNKKNLLDRIRDAKKRERLPEEKNPEPEDNRLDSELSVDELAARQLIKEAKDRLAQGNNKNENKVSVLPLNQETVSLEGEKESTLEDYEAVPISDYGLALLRGMGWKEGMTVGKNTSKTVVVSVPEVRPKGLGLGATKVIQSEIPTKKPVDKDGKELILVKGAYAKVIAGFKKGNYCEVQGFDEEAGRVIVKVYPKGDNLNINEFMLVPVTKEEFSMGSKILNNAKYEEYLEKSDSKLKQFKIKEEHSDSINITEQNSDMDSDGPSQGSTKNKKYNKDIKNFPISSEERDSHSRRGDGRIRNKRKSDSSNSEYETTRKRTKLKYRDRSRSQSASRRKNNKDKNRRHSDSSSDYEREKKSSKHAKSKYQDRSRDESKSRDKYKKDKKHKSKHRRDSSGSDSKKDKRKKNKCKSRHRRDTSSSDRDRKSIKSKEIIETKVC